MSSSNQQAAQQQQEPTPEDKIANAEIGRVQAETQDVVSKTEERQNNMILKANKQQADQELAELKLMLQQQSQQAAQQNQNMEAMMKGHAQVFDTLKTQAETLDTLRQAMGVEAISSPETVEAYNNQAEMITEPARKYWRFVRRGAYGDC